MRSEFRLILLLFLLLAPMFVWIGRELDRTNLSTTNGLWKAPGIHEWERGEGKFLDSGAVLYYPLMGFLCRVSPDGWWQYGAASPIVTFREMAAWNAVASALSTAAVAGLILRISGSLLTALFVASFHASMAFVMVHTWNSEDIMPGYAMWVVGSYCFFRLVTGGGRWWAAASSVAYATATLLHWTLTPAAIGAVGLGYLWFAAGNWRERWQIPVLAGATYLAAVAILVRTLTPESGRTLYQILYPAKASTSGWVGFLPEKFRLLLVAIPNYFTGGYNVGSVSAAWDYPPSRMAIFAGYAWFVLIAAGVSWLWLRGNATRRLFAIWGVALFAIAQTMNIYAQPQDPQMQIQPMFVGVVGFFGFVSWILSGRSRRWEWAGAVATLVAMLANGIWSFKQLRLSTATDSQSIQASRAFQKELPRESHFLVIQGMDGWLTWEVVLNHAGSTDDFAKRGILLSAPFTYFPKASGAETAEYLRGGIEKARKRGMRVFASVLWPGGKEQLQRELSTVATPEEADALYSEMLRAYTVIGEQQTVYARFVEIAPAK